MKRFFKSLAFASAALAGFLMTSCTVEEIKTTFEPSAAEATIEVSVFDAANGVDVTSSATINQPTSTGSNSISVKGNVITITGNYAIAEQTVTFTATYAGVTSAPVSVPVNSLLAGGVAKYAALAIVGSAIDADEYVAEKFGDAVVTTKTSTFQPLNGHEGYSHDYSHASVGHGEGTGIWAYNESEFILEGEINYKNYDGMEVRNFALTSACVKTEEAIANTLAEPYAAQKVKETDEVLNIKVSAWAMYSAYGTITESAQPYKIYRVTGDEKVAIATFDFVSVSTQAEYTEAAMPGHDGHYQHGHGSIDHSHGHGGSNNAGGGIIWAE